jgi:hypothetical protein
MNRFLSIAVRCSLICAAAAPLHAQAMGKTPAKAAMADSQHSAMMPDSSKKHDAMKPKGAMAKDSGSAMKKPMAKESAMGSKKPAAKKSGMGIEKPMAKDSGMAMGKPMAKDSGMMKKPQR